ncbi:MAG: TetR/AcrR family transcriptional regulator [Myxococcales bacterium]
MTVHRSSEERRQEIAEVALALFGEVGFGGLTASAIARRIGVTDAALFRHFDTKDEILALALDRAEAILFEGVQVAAEDPLERLGQFFRARVGRFREHPGVAKLVGSSQLADAAPWAAERLDGFRQRSQRFVRTCLKEAGETGVLRQDVGPRLAAVIVVGALFALGQGDLAEAGGPTADEVWDALDRMLRAPTRKRRQRAGLLAPRAATRKKSRRR